MKTLKELVESQGSVYNFTGGENSRYFKLLRWLKNDCVVDDDGNVYKKVGTIKELKE